MHGLQAYKEWAYFKLYKSDEIAVCAICIRLAQLM